MATHNFRTILSQTAASYLAVACSWLVQSFFVIYGFTRWAVEGLEPLKPLPGEVWQYNGGVPSTLRAGPQRVCNESNEPNLAELQQLYVPAVYSWYL